MKTRNGFVSNSSSSSFVVIGARIPRKELKELGWYEDGIYNYDKIPGRIQIYDVESGDLIVGTPICKSEDWGLVDEEMTQQEIGETFLDVSDKLQNRTIKLLMGTRPT